MKRFLLMLTLMLLGASFAFSPVSFAYPGGLLNGKTLNVGSTSSSSDYGTTKLITDNDENTKYTLGQTAAYIWYEFITPVDIKAYQLRSDSAAHSLHFYDSENKSIKNISVPSDVKDKGTKVSIEVLNVKKVVLAGNNHPSNISVREFDVFTEYTAEPPDSPTGLTATPGDKIASLSWNAVSGATGYNVYRDGTKVNGGPITGTSHTITGLTNGTTYSIQVTAVNENGESAKSSAVNVKPVGSPPAAPTGLTATPGDKIASLGWNTVAGATGYNVYRDGTKVNGGPITGTSHTITGLTNGTTYSIQVTAVNENGESAKSSAVNVKPVGSPPAAPTGLTATPGDKITSLEWNPVADATGYNVYKDGTKVNGSPITGTSHTITGLTNGTTYSIQVAAVNENGESTKSSAVNVTPVGSAPAAPTGLNATPGDKIASLSWNPVTVATGYNVYKDGTKVNGSPITGTSHTITGLTNGTIYSIQVSAVNENGESTKSSAVNVTPVGSPPAAPTGLTATPGDEIITLEWNPVADATGYNIYRDGVKVNGSPITGTSHTITDLTNGKTYSIQVAAVNESGESAKSSAVNVKPVKPSGPPAAPSRLSAVVGNKQVKLSWNPVPGAAGYNVYVDGEKANESPVIGSEYIVQDLENGQSYTFAVAAQNDFGESLLSPPIDRVPAEPPLNIDVDLPFGALDTVKSGLSFLGMFRDYVLLGLGVVVGMILIMFLFAITGKAKPKKGKRDKKISREKLKEYKDKLEKTKNDRETYIRESKGTRDYGSKQYTDRLRQYRRMETYYTNRISAATEQRPTREQRATQPVVRDRPISTKAEPIRDQRQARQGRPGRQGR